MATVQVVINTEKVVVAVVVKDREQLLCKLDGGHHGQTTFRLVESFLNEVASSG